MDTTLELGPPLTPERAHDLVVAATGRLLADEAAGALDQALESLGLDATVTGVLLPALTTVGSGSERGELGVHHEHLLSSVANAWLSGTIAALRREAPTRPVLLTAGPEETHVLGLLAFEALLAGRGVRVYNLGGQLPGAALQDAAAQLHPVVVVMVAQREANLAGAEAALATLHTDPADLYYGGAAFADLAGRSGFAGTYLGEDMVAAADLMARLVAEREAGRPGVAGVTGSGPRDDAQPPTVAP